jgi:succinate dehydrogenase / fumarate reductase iron-sulfur subunit
MGKILRLASICRSPEQREKLDGLYECILHVVQPLPVVLVEPGQVYRPGGLLLPYRFLIDSRDTETSEYLAEPAFSVLLHAL